MDQEKKDRLSSILQMPIQEGFRGYLGVPTDFGQHKKDLFAGIIKSVEGRLESWRNVFLSQAGRLTLIKSVLTSLSNHVLSAFKIPGCIADRSKGVHWRSWAFITRPKEQGGLGIRDVKMLNRSLLAKDSLLSKTLGPKYGLFENLFWSGNWRRRKGGT
ncbi:hypothetical protein RDABS01_010795 [Bienertia sinuspersici]